MVPTYLLENQAGAERPSPPAPAPVTPTSATPPGTPAEATAPRAAVIPQPPYASLAPLGLTADPARSISYSPFGSPAQRLMYGRQSDNAEDWIAGRTSGPGYPVHTHLPTQALVGDQVWSDTWPVPYVGPLSIDNSGTAGPMETPETRRLYRELYRREPTIRAAINGKAEAVACLDISVIPRDNHNEHDCRAAEFVKWSVENTLLGWDGLIRAIVTPALIDGYSVLEKTALVVAPEWGREWAGLYGLQHCRMLDTAWIRLQLDQYRNVLSVVNLVRGLQYYSVDKFILFSYSSLWNNPFGQSDLRACIRSCALIEDSYKLWYLALKMFGMPYLVGKVSVPAQRAMMADALESLRAGGFCVTGVDDEVDLLNLASAASFNAFEANVRAMREDNFMAIRGAYLPFLEGVGGADAHGNTAISKVASDTNTFLLAKSVARVLSHQLVPWLVRDNFPRGTGYPTVVLGGDDLDETKQTLDIGLKLFQEFGLPISKDQLYKRANFAPPDGPDDAVDYIALQTKQQQAQAQVQMQVQAQQMQMQAGQQMQLQQGQQAHEAQMQQAQAAQQPPPDDAGGGGGAGGGAGGGGNPSEFELGEARQFSEGAPAEKPLDAARLAAVAASLMADLAGVRVFAAPAPEPPTPKRGRKPTAPTPPAEPDPPPTDYGAQERNAFEANIDKNPLEATHHLVYADWLRERGHHDEADFRQAMGDWVKHFRPGEGSPKWNTLHGTSWHAGAVPAGHYIGVPTGVPPESFDPLREEDWDRDWSVDPPESHRPRWVQHDNDRRPIGWMWDSYRGMEEGFRRAFMARRAANPPEQLSAGARAFAEPPPVPAEPATRTPGDFHDRLVHHPEDRHAALVYADYLHDSGREAHADLVRGHQQHHAGGTDRQSFWAPEVANHREGVFYARPQSVAGVPHVNLFQLSEARHAESPGSRHQLHWRVPVADREAQFALLTRLRAEGAKSPPELVPHLPDGPAEVSEDPSHAALFAAGARPNAPKVDRTGPAPKFAGRPVPPPTKPGSGTPVRPRVEADPDRGQVADDAGDLPAATPVALPVRKPQAAPVAATYPTRQDTYPIQQPAPNPAPPPAPPAAGYPLANPLAQVRPPVPESVQPAPGELRPGLRPSPHQAVVDRHRDWIAGHPVTKQLSHLAGVAPAAAEDAVRRAMRQLLAGGQSAAEVVVTGASGKRVRATLRRKAKPVGRTFSEWAGTAEMFTLEPTFADTP